MKDEGEMGGWVGGARCAVSSKCGTWAGVESSVMCSEDNGMTDTDVNTLITHRLQRLGGRCVANVCSGCILQNVKTSDSSI